MSDYTPTTEEVRKGYAGALYLSDVPRDRSQEFDRWLAEVKAQAWEEGLQAKFKLLEGQDSVSLTNPYRPKESE